MSRPLLVLRPEPGASVTVAAARGMGLDAVAAPLFVVRPVTWTPPTAPPPALLMTSAAAARHAGTAVAAYRGLPLYAVGEATARAARDAGFANITVGEGGIDAILARAVEDEVAGLLHLVGREHQPPAVVAIPIERRIVYAADAVDRLPEAARGILPRAVALLHSSRAAATFARLVDHAALPRDLIDIAAISAAARASVGVGWRTEATAALPNDAALLAAAAKLCDQGA
jgi:uroporphyrinogen-III synthase